MTTRQLYRTAHLRRDDNRRNPIHQRRALRRHLDRDHRAQLAEL